MKKSLLFSFQSLFLIIFLFTWELTTKNSQKLSFLFSYPSKIFYTLIENLGNGTLINDFITTISEVILGFIIGNILGSIIGLSLWYSENVAKFIKPFLVALGAIPIITLAPMMIIWFGTGFSAKVTMSALSTIIVAIIQSYEGASNIDNDLIKLFKSFGSKRIQIFYHLVIPSSLIWVFNSLKLNVGFSIMGAVVAEYISSEKGLAHTIFRAGGLYDVSLVISALILIMLMAVLLNFIVEKIQRFSMNWLKKNPLEN